MCTRFADKGDKGIEKPHIAIFDTLSPVSATSLATSLCLLDTELEPYKNQISLGGHRQEARQLSPDLYRGQQYFQEVTPSQNTYVDLPD